MYLNLLNNSQYSPHSYPTPESKSVTSFISFPKAPRFDGLYIKTAEKVKNLQTKSLIKVQ